MTYNKKVFKEAIFSSFSVVEDYFQKNNLKETSFYPIAITNTKKSTGWASSNLASPLKIGLLEIVSSKIRKPIYVKEFDKDDAPSIQGVCLEKESSATIYVSKTLNFCWRRFIVAKELSHLLMNKVDNDLRTADMNEVLELMSYLVTPNSNTKNTVQLSEYVAYLGAIEMLMPRQYIENGLFESSLVIEKIKCPRQMFEARQKDPIKGIFTDIYEDPMSDMASIIDKLNRAV